MQPKPYDPASMQTQYLEFLRFGKENQNIDFLYKNMVYQDDMNNEYEDEEKDSFAGERCAFCSSILISTSMSDYLFVPKHENAGKLNQDRYCITCAECKKQYYKLTFPQCTKCKRVFKYDENFIVNIPKECQPHRGVEYVVLKDSKHDFIVVNENFLEKPSETQEACSEAKITKKIKENFRSCNLM